MDSLYQLDHKAKASLGLTFDSLQSLTVAVEPAHFRLSAECFPNIQGCFKKKKKKTLPNLPVSSL